MPRNAQAIKNIVIHCSAGFGKRKSIEAWWATLGWKSPGYHRLIERDGTVHELADFSAVTNGVYGYNKSTIHICYVGGVENTNTKEDPIWVPKDTRTAEQLISMHKCIKDAIFWLADNGKDIRSNLGIVGHRDFSIDQNSNGVIEPWERNKDCPSFDVMREFSYLYASPDRYNTLPYN